MQSLLQFAEQAWTIWVEAAPWLLVGIIAAGLLKVWMPTRFLNRWLGGSGVLPPLKAAIIGTPIPLCSCSVLPAAVQLHRSGASKGATVSFLIATPENGADSIAVSYALLGPMMTVLRVFAAITSAVAAGLLTECLARNNARKPSDLLGTVGSDDCCQADCCGSNPSTARVDHPASALSGLRYAFTDLLDDLAVWLMLGILLAAAVQTFVPASVMASWGSGPWAMLAILAVSVPMYICATASTPIAASLILSGMSPGTALVFLLAGPATNFSSAGVIIRELGLRAFLSYLAGVIGVSLALGMLLDWLLMEWQLVIPIQQPGVIHFMPEWLAVAAAIVMGLLLIRSLVWRLRIQTTRRKDSAPEDSRDSHFDGDVERLSSSNMPSI